jgi:hypothetical protein
MVVPGTVVPVPPILLEGQHGCAMFADLKRRYQLKGKLAEKDTEAKS